MAIITLTTDFGTKDPSAGAVRGAILSEMSDAQIVDISHEVSPFLIHEAAYIIKNAYKNFPDGTIHIIGVDGELTPENKHIAVKLDGHYFVCANNGIISLIAKDILPEEVAEINIHDRVNTNFTVLDIFVQVACHIARGGTLGVIGKPLSELKTLTGIQPVVNNAQTKITGGVLYVDNYGNVISTIDKTLFENVGKGRNFRIEARGTVLTQIYRTYSEAINFTIERTKREDDGKKLAIFNSGDYIELAIYKSNPFTVGSAASLFGLTYRDTIMITFDEK